MHRTGICDLYVIRMSEVPLVIETVIVRFTRKGSRDLPHVTNRRLYHSILYCLSKWIDDLTWSDVHFSYEGGTQPRVSKVISDVYQRGLKGLLILLVHMIDSLSLPCVEHVRVDENGQELSFYSTSGSWFVSAVFNESIAAPQLCKRAV